MRTLALLLVACSSGSPGSSGSSGSSGPSGAPTSPKVEPRILPPADPLEIGRPVDREIGAQAVHRYRLELPLGNVATGVVMQNGVDVVVVTFDPSGNKLAEFDSPNGNKGPESFSIEATIVAGAYDFEVRPFIEPSGSGAPTSGSGAPIGRYEAKLDAILTADAFAERSAKERIDSPRILELWRAVRAKRTADVEKFWTDLKGKSPIVEPYPGAPNDVLITFVQRSRMPYVAVIGVTDFREKPLVRIGDSELWYLTARMPKDSRFDYAFIVTDGPPEFRMPFRKERGPDVRFSKQQLDPNNPLTRFTQSRVELPDAPPQPWIVAKPETPAGKITTIKLDSVHLKENRRIGVYTPAGYDAKQRYPLVVVFDGEVYGLDAGSMIPLPTIVDNLIAAKKIPPIVLALVANQGTRERDLPGSEEFSAFVAKELIPKLRTEYRAGLTPATTIATGSSFGGLSSTFTAFHHPDVIGNVLSQSGAYQFRRGSIGVDVSDFVEGNWMTRDVASTPKKPLRFYLDSGLFEPEILASNRQLRDVLVAKGYPLTYVEFSGAHDYWMWRGTISDGLIALLK